MGATNSANQSRNAEHNAAMPIAGSMNRKKIFVLDRTYCSYKIARRIGVSDAPGFVAG